MKANELSCKDLMIGDWVYNTHNQQNEQVHEIGSGLVMLNYNDIYEYDEIEPIPLTVETLIKNGFDINGIPENMQPVEERDWSDDTYVWSCPETPDDSMTVSIYACDYYNFYVEIICQYCHVDGIHIKFVHELQHLLRLCKINKEIEL